MSMKSQRDHSVIPRERIYTCQIVFDKSDPEVLSRHVCGDYSDFHTRDQMVVEVIKDREHGNPMLLSLSIYCH